MTPGTTRGKKAAATRKSLLHAALEVMSRKGYTAATIDEIAKEAGVSKGLAYYHFKSKGEIATEILANGINDLIGTFESIAADSQSAGEALQGMLNAFCDKIAGDWRFGRFYLQAMWRGGRVWSENMHDIEMRLIEIIAEQFKRAQTENLVREDIDAEFAAVACVGLVLTSAMRYFGSDDVDEPKISKEQFTQEIVDFVTNATEVHE